MGQPCSMKLEVRGSRAIRAADGCTHKEVLTWSMARKGTRGHIGLCVFCTRCKQRLACVADARVYPCQSVAEIEGRSLQ